MFWNIVKYVNKIKNYLKNLYVLIFVDFNVSWNKVKNS